MTVKLIEVPVYTGIYHFGRKSNVPDGAWLYSSDGVWQGVPVPADGTIERVSISNDIAGGFTLEIFSNGVKIAETTVGVSEKKKIDDTISADVQEADILQCKITNGIAKNLTVMLETNWRY